jgi:exonuclease III
VQRFRKDTWLQQANPDVICLQEIKATPEQPLLDFELAGYPYHYWFPATKKGYSGTAIYLKSNLIMCFMEPALSIWTLKDEISV